MTHPLRIDAPDPSRHIPAVRFALACAALVLLSACAPSGDDPLNRLTTHEPETGEYRLRYLEPPWELVSASGTTTFLRIQSNAMSVAGVEGGPGKYELTVSVEPGVPLRRAADELRAARGRGEEILGDGVRNVTTDEGVVGAELLTRESMVYALGHRRTVFFPLDGSRVVRLGFEATPALDTAEVDAMIAAFGIGSAP